VSEEFLWVGKPYLMKTFVKSLIIYVLISLIFTPIFMFVPLLFIVWTLFAIIFLTIYFLNKRAYTYYLTSKSVRVVKSWVFGTYAREITFDQVRDIHVFQGILARIFKCGSVVFTTTTGLEVGGVVFKPFLARSRANRFWDVKDPHSVRELITKQLVAWREVYQQQRIATAVEKIAERAQPQTSVSEELERLKKLLDQGAITREEYEKLKKQLIGSS
jgi:uncharacterized membrane protein YdbT with pleckstrin-like domain